MTQKRTFAPALCLRGSYRSFISVCRPTSKARIEGLPLIPLLDQRVEALSPGHEDFTHRYTNSGDEVSLIKWPLAFAVLNDRDNAVDAQIGARASRGLGPRS